MNTTGVCFATYLSPTPIISATAAETEEIMFAAAPICELTAPITGTTLKTVAVSFRTFAILVMPFKNGFDLPW